MLTCYWRRKWQPTPVSLPGKSHGQRSLVGCSPWGRKESGMTERLNWTELNILRSESQDRPEFKFWLSHLLTSRSWASHFISSFVSTFMRSFWYRGRPMVNMSICYGYYSFKSLHLSILARPVYIPFPPIWHPYTFNPCYALYLKCPISLLVQIPYPTLLQPGLLKLLQVWAPCMDDPSPRWASLGGSLLGGGGVAQ